MADPDISLLVAAWNLLEHKYQKATILRFFLSSSPARQLKAARLLTPRQARTVIEDMRPYQKKNAARLSMPVVLALDSAADPEQFVEPPLPKAEGWLEAQHAIADKVRKLARSGNTISEEMHQALLVEHKVELMAQRVSAGQALHHPDDAIQTEHHRRRARDRDAHYNSALAVLKMTTHGGLCDVTSHTSGRTA